MSHFSRCPEKVQTLQGTGWGDFFPRCGESTPPLPPPPPTASVLILGPVGLCPGEWSHLGLSPPHPSHSWLQWAHPHLFLGYVEWSEPHFTQWECGGGGWSGQCVYSLYNTVSTVWEGMGHRFVYVLGIFCKIKNAMFTVHNAQVITW